MEKGTLFWGIWIAVLLFGGFHVFRSDAQNRVWLGGFSLAVWVELGLIGWKIFGEAVK